MIDACDTHIHVYDGRWPIAPNAFALAWRRNASASILFSNSAVGPRPKVRAGWRGGKGGIRIYVQGADGWKAEALDDGGITCEDLKVADLNGDGHVDIVFANPADFSAVDLFFFIDWVTTVI